MYPSGAENILTFFGPGTVAAVTRSKKFSGKHWRNMGCRSVSSSVPRPTLSDSVKRDSSFSWTFLGQQLLLDHQTPLEILTNQTG